MRASLICTLALTLICPAAKAASPYVDTLSPRVKQLLSELTLEEKSGLNTGAKEPVYAGQAGYTSGVPRLGIPALRWADGGRGINSVFDGTALPSSMSLAATFNPDVAYQSGVLLGEEARAMGIDVVLAPFVNFARLPGSSSALGEDPLLAARLAEPQVRGIQSAGALAMTQQFIGATQNLHRGGGLNAEQGWDFVFDDRVLHELHLPVFEAAIRGGTASIMAAYNMQNGALNTENERTLVGVLRDELGFAGWVNSDWNANRSTVSINKGLDFEMPGVGPIVIPSYPPQWGPKLKAAVDAGQVSVASLDRAVGRFLGQLERYGLLDNTRKPAPLQVDVQKDAAVARAMAVQGAVLIKNDGALPLKPQNLQRLALIGPTAGQLAAGAGGNRAYGFPERLVAPLAAL
ncbi:MAG: glycoside hydrolase family 3 N-terminal domain-containing protein, partial [Steroidobacteraceae bacterium]